MKKLFSLLLTVSLILSLAACGSAPQAPTVSFSAAGATGYEWQCRVDEAVALCESTTEVSDDMPGAAVSYRFAFTGVAAGEAVAVFTFGRSWENDYVRCLCSVSVDDALCVTLGEVSAYELVVDPGSADYQVLCLDESVAAPAQDAESGLCIFAAIAPGTTKAVFFYRGDEEDMPDLVYDITVDEDGMFYWMQAEPDEYGTVNTGFTDYSSAEKLSEATGLFVPALDEMKQCTYTGLDEPALAYVTFYWDEVSVSYAAGLSSPERLTDETTTEMTVAGTTVYVTAGSRSDPSRSDVTAAWECDGTYCYIVSEDEGFTAELMETILTAVIEAQNA